MKALEGKVVVLGSRGVGKTSLVSQFVHNKCNKEQEPTIAASFFVCKVYVDDVKVKLHIWDTAGQERFKAVAPMYYRNANVALLVFDLCQYKTFIDIKSWVQELHRIVQDPLVLILVGNKLDLEQTRSVSRDEAMLYASSIGAKYFETSAQNKTGLNQVFLASATGLLRLEKENKCDTLHRHDSDDSLSAYNNNAIIENAIIVDDNYGRLTSTLASSSSSHSSTKKFQNAILNLPAVQMGIPVDNHIKANDIGRIETSSWSINYIAHGDEERRVWCC